MNSVKCLQCGKTLTSTYRHDFQMCNCENQTFCDGGDDYQRLGGVDMEKIAVFDNESKKYIKWQKHSETVSVSRSMLSPGLPK